MSIEVSTAIRGHRASIVARGTAKKLPRYYVELDPASGLRLSRLLDGPMFMFLLAAMRERKPLHMRGKVTAQALRNAEHLQEAWANMSPAEYHRIEIRADEVVPDAFVTLAPRRAIAAFSGGMDASFTALRHGLRLAGAGAYPLTHVLCIHGPDVPSDRADTFKAVSDRTRPILDAAGVTPVYVRTNLRKPTPVNWEHNFAAIIGGILHMVATRSHRWGLLGSSKPHSQLVVPWGSSPSTDYLISGGAFSLVHDGAGFTRTEKAAFLAGYPAALAGMRVCYSDVTKPGNCGKCEKCIRTRLNFMTVGVDDPPMFDTPFSLELMQGLRPRNEAQRTELAMILDYADAAALTAPWLTALRAIMTSPPDP